MRQRYYLNLKNEIYDLNRTVTIIWRSDAKTSPPAAAGAAEKLEKWKWEAAAVPSCRRIDNMLTGMDILEVQQSYVKAVQSLFARRGFADV